MKKNDGNVIRFMAKLSDEEFRFVRLLVQQAQNARETVKKYNISPEEFCETLQIQPGQYNAFMRGGFNYSVRHMARLEALYMKHFYEEAHKTAIKEAQSMNLIKIEEIKTEEI